MKFFSFGVITATFLFALNLTGQKYTKEQLNSLEQEVLLIKNDSAFFALDKPTTENQFDLYASKVVQSADSLLVFATSQKHDKTGAFETAILPVLEVKCKKLDLKALRFNEDETMVFDSFLQVLEWGKALATVNLYNDFILKNTTNLEEAQAVLTVLAFIKHLNYHLKSKIKVNSRAIVYECVAANFNINNDIDWQVFALNPGRMVFWTLASCAWEIPIEK